MVSHDCNATGGHASIQVVKVSNLKTWGSAVRATLKKGAEREAHVAERIGLNRGMLHQYLSGVRRPSADTLRAIAQAVGELVGRDSAQAYLDAEARCQGLLDVNNDELLHDGLAACELVVGIITPGFVHRFSGAVAGLQAAGRRKFLLLLHHAHCKALFDAIDGRVSARSGFDALRSVFANARLNLDALLDDGEPGASQTARVRAELLTEIRRAIATVAPHASAKERFMAEYAIADAFSEYLQCSPCITAPRPPSHSERIRARMRRWERDGRLRRTDDSISATNHRAGVITPLQGPAYAKTSRRSRRRKGNKP